MTPPAPITAVLRIHPQKSQPQKGGPNYGEGRGGRGGVIERPLVLIYTLMFQTPSPRNDQIDRHPARTFPNGIHCLASAKAVWRIRMALSHTRKILCRTPPPSPTSFYPWMTREAQTHSVETTMSLFQPHLQATIAVNGLRIIHIYKDTTILCNCFSISVKRTTTTASVECTHRTLPYSLARPFVRTSSYTSIVR